MSITTAAIPATTDTAPNSQNDQAEKWLENQRDLLLPIIHFMAAFTLPDELRDMARSHRKILYNILFRSSAAAVQELAKDPRFIGGIIGLMGVLQTWRRDRGYHPHIHYLIAGGGTLL